MENQLIKLVETNSYTVGIIQTDEGFVVQHGNSKVLHNSEVIFEYNTASYLFDLKLQELQGN